MFWSRVFNKRLILCIGHEKIIVLLMHTLTSLIASAPTKQKVNLRFRLYLVRLDLEPGQEVQIDCPLLGEEQRKDAKVK